MVKESADWTVLPCSRSAPHGVHRSLIGLSRSRMFRRLCFLLVSLSFLCVTKPVQTYLVRRSSSVVANQSNYRFPFVGGKSLRQLTALTPLSAYPMLVNGNAYDSKQVSNTLWNLLSIARFILCTCVALFVSPLLTQCLSLA